MKSVAFVIVSLFALPAAADEGRIEAVMNPMGASLSQDPRVFNFASPMVELRTSAYFGSKNRWLAADTGFALLVLPEYVAEARVAARLYPWRLAGSKPTGFAGSLYVRPGVHSYLLIDGFDAGPDVEFGLAPSSRRVSLLLGMGLAGYVVRPRIVLELRFGVGFLF